MENAQSLRQREPCFTHRRVGNTCGGRGRGEGSGGGGGCGKGGGRTIGLQKGSGRGSQQGKVFSMGGEAARTIGVGSEAHSCCNPPPEKQDLDNTSKQQTNLLLRTTHRKYNRHWEIFFGMTLLQKQAHRTRFEINFSGSLERQQILPALFLVQTFKPDQAFHVVPQAIVAGPNRFL